MPEGFTVEDVNLDSRDAYGNLTEGIVPPQISVPVAKYYGGVNGKTSTDGGSMVYLSQEELKELYTDYETTEVSMKVLWMRRLQKDI